VFQGNPVFTGVYAGFNQGVFQGNPVFTGGYAGFNQVCSKVTLYLQGCM